MSKIGYAVICYGDDIKRLTLTFGRSEISNEEKILVIWSNAKGNPPEELDPDGFTGITWDDIELKRYPDKLTCLEARRIAFGYFKNMPGIEYIQYIDSGDVIYAGYDESDLEGDYNMYWSPVLVTLSMFDYLFDPDGKYSSFGPSEPLTADEIADELFQDYYSTLFVEIIKEDADSDFEWAIENKFSRDLKLPHIGLTQRELDSYHQPTCKLYDSSKFDLNSKYFGMISHSVVAMPWKINTLRLAFDLLDRLGSDCKFNLGEDMVLHCAARIALKDIKCKELRGSYSYNYYPDSITHKKKTSRYFRELRKANDMCIRILQCESSDLKYDFK